MIQTAHNPEVASYPESEFMPCIWTYRNPLILEGIKGKR